VGAKAARTACIINHERSPDPISNQMRSRKCDDRRTNLVFIRNRRAPGVVSVMNGEGFASRLERAIARLSAAPELIEYRWTSEDAKGSDQDHSFNDFEKSRSTVQNR
jgi:hypothetical protein